MKKIAVALLASFFLSGKVEAKTTWVKKADDLIFCCGVYK